MSDSDSPFVDKKPKKQAKAKSKGNAKKRERTPSEYDPEDEPYVDGGEEDDDEGEEDGVDEEEESTPKKKQKGGSKKATPTKKAKTGGSASTAGGSSSPGGKPVWTAKMKRELFSAMLGQATKANCTEVAVKLGKEPSQCYDQWRRVLLPAIYKKIDEMG